MMSQLTPNNILNYAAQQQLPSTWTQHWFCTLPTDQQQNTLVLLQFFLLQSHPTTEMVQAAVTAQPAKPFTTPMVLLQSHPFTVALRKIIALPTPEYPNAFRVLLVLFSIADTHRRVYSCQGDCTHEWHNLPSLPLEVTS